MITLFLNTAYQRIVVSIIEDDKILFFTEEDNERDFSSRIMSIIDEGFKSAGIGVKEIDNIMVVNGPGSFTGIRIGVTIAKVMAWSFNKKLIPISTLECLASTPFIGNHIVSLIDARRGYVYAGGYDHNLNCVFADRYVDCNKISDISNEQICLVSDDEFSFVTIRPKIDILKIVNKHLNDNGVNPHELKPNYLKRTEAEENLEKGMKYDKTCI